MSIEVGSRDLEGFPVIPCCMNWLHSAMHCFHLSTMCNIVPTVLVYSSVSQAHIFLGTRAVNTELEMATSPVETYIEFPISR